MLGPKILPAICLVLSATILLIAQASAGKPAAGVCSIRPGSSAPQGTRWYYRVRQTDHRRCWFLSSEGMKVRSYARGVIVGCGIAKPNTEARQCFRNSSRNTTANDIRTNSVCSNGARTGNSRRPCILRNTGP
jgi:hypothetical protein